MGPPAVELLGVRVGHGLALIRAQDLIEVLRFDVGVGLLRPGADVPEVLDRWPCRTPWIHRRG